MSCTEEAQPGCGGNHPGHLLLHTFPSTRIFCFQDTLFVWRWGLGVGGGDVLGKSRSWAGEGKRRGKQKPRFWQYRFWKSRTDRPGTTGRGEVRAQRGSLQSGSVAPQQIPCEAMGPGQLQGFCTFLSAPARQEGEPKVTPRLLPLSQTAAYHRGPGKPSQ